MNNRGQGLMMAIVIGILFFAGGIMFVNLISDNVTTAESSSGLNCNDLTNPDGIKLACLGTGIVVPYLIIIIFSTAIGVVASRFL